MSDINFKTEDFIVDIDHVFFKNLFVDEVAIVVPHGSLSLNVSYSLCNGKLEKNSTTCKKLNSLEDELFPIVLELKNGFCFKGCFKMMCYDWCVADDGEDVCKISGELMRHNREYHREYSSEEEVYD
jgi:hypothetical protein